MLSLNYYGYGGLEMARKRKIETEVEVEQTKTVSEKTTEAVDADTRICVEVTDKYKNISSMIIDNRLVTIEDGKIYIWSSQHKELAEGGYVK